MIHGAEIDVLKGEAGGAAAGIYLAGKGALVGGEGAAGGYGGRAGLDVAA